MAEPTKTETPKGMIQANAVVKLSKEHEVALNGITPIEALLLVAEHHKNVGGNPVEVDKATIKEVSPPRTIDDELNRLRGKYAQAKVRAIANEVKELPSTFEKAIELGTRITLPSQSMSSMKLI